MAKIPFLQNPTFPVDVEIPRLGGNSVKVKIIFNHLDRDQFAELADTDIAYSREVSELTQDQQSKVADLTARAKEHQFDQLKKVVNGWGFTEEFNDENLQALVGHSAETAAAIIGAFRNAYEKAREGNFESVARAIYTPGATAADLALFGLSPDDVSEAVEVWECNRQALVLFDAMGTQWRTGMNGATGLDYQVLPVTMEMLGMDAGKRQALFHDIRIMERAALDAMAEARDE